MGQGELGTYPHPPRTDFFRALLDGSPAKLIKDNWNRSREKVWFGLEYKGFEGDATMPGLSVQADETFGSVPTDITMDSDSDDPDSDDENTVVGGGGGQSDSPVDTTPVTMLVWVFAVFAAIGGMLFGYDIGVIGGVTTMVRSRISVFAWLEGGEEERSIAS
jgi:hypothetical protein